jgi:hypothetical protein
MPDGFPDWIDSETTERKGLPVLLFYPKEIGKDYEAPVLLLASTPAPQIDHVKQIIVDVLADRVLAHRHPELGENIYHDLNIRYFEAAAADRPQDMTEADFALFEEYAALTGAANPLARNPEITS